MPERTLEDWLSWIEARHPRQIELGLDRIAQVAARLPLQIDKPVITIGGTNGKGSTVAFLESILGLAGIRVGAYSSPHLLRYNERIRIEGQPVSDARLCEAFGAIERALGDVSLTYFEFGTLAALWLFEQAQLDVLVLEVGLGGRLDSVNLIDADVAVLTTIDLDHQDWLGTDREAIGYEKAGIFRAGRPALCIDPAPPQSVIDHARQCGANWLPLGEAFTLARSDDRWSWHGDGLPYPAWYLDLPLPKLPLPSAAAALAALHCLPLALDEGIVREGLRRARLPGRFQRFWRDDIEIILDVAHNPQAAGFLANNLAALPPRRTRALFALMADKDLDGLVQPLRGHFEQWWLGDLPDNPRALPAAELARHLAAQGIDHTLRGESVGDAFEAALASLEPGDRLVVFGSFFTVAAALERIEASPARYRDTD